MLEAVSANDHGVVCRVVEQTVRCEDEAVWLFHIDCYNCGYRAVPICAFHAPAVDGPTSYCRRCGFVGVEVLNLTAIAADMRNGSG